MVGCAPASPSDDAIASSIVVTKHAPQANFSSYHTYFLRPEIRELSGTAVPPLADSIATPLLAQTELNMTKRGFTRVDDKAVADLAVELVYIDAQWVSTYCYSWWDPYYWGYPYYPYYPYYGGCSAVTTQTNLLSTTIVDMVEARDSIGDAGVPDAGPLADGGGSIATKIMAGIWFSGVYGLVFSTSDSLAKAIDGINQGFEQSPYLVTH
jgi:hypothetical protein